MNFLEKIKEYKDSFIIDLQKFIQIPSVLEENPDDKEAPFGKEVRKSLDYILALGESFGFKTLNVDNVAGHIEYGEGEEIIGVLCHTDVVPAEGTWKYPPYSGYIEGDKMYGRGTNDDKGPTICALYALKMLKDLGIKPNKRIRLIVGTDEETGMRGVKRYLEVCEMPTFGFSPDADFPIIYGEKGIMSFDIVGKNKDKDLVSMKGGTRYNIVCDDVVLNYKKDLSNEFGKYLQSNDLKGKQENSNYEVFGKSAHAMEPRNGLNAIVKMCNFLSEYSSNELVKFISKYLNSSRLKDMGLDFTDKEMGDLTSNVAIVRINENESRLGLNFRYPINFDKENFFNVWNKLLSEYNLKLDLKEDKGPHYVNKEDKDIEVLHQAYIKYTNDTETPLKTIGGGTYARALKKGVAFGILFPDEEELAHQENECISIERTLLAGAIIAEAIYNLGK